MQSNLTRLLMSRCKPPTHSTETFSKQTRSQFPLGLIQILKAPRGSIFGGVYLPLLDTTPSSSIKTKDFISWRGQVAGWTVLCQSDGGIVEKDKWIHVAVTGDGDKFRIYADGEIGRRNRLSRNTDGNECQPTVLGGSGGETFAGLLDDYAVFSRALDEDEISLIMESVETFLPVEPKGKLATQWAALKR